MTSAVFLLCSRFGYSDLSWTGLNFSYSFGASLKNSFFVSCKCSNLSSSFAFVTCWEASIGNSKFSKSYANEGSSKTAVGAQFAAY